MKDMLQGREEGESVGDHLPEYAMSCLILTNS